MSPIFTADDPIHPESPAEPACPVCGGRLYELRGQSRCGRCYFVLCQGCEADPPRPIPVDETHW